MRELKRILRYIRNYMQFEMSKKEYEIDVMNTEETLYDIINNRKSIARFGDGEFSLIFGRDLNFQKYSPEIEMKYREILKALPEKTKYCNVAIPYVYKSLKGFNLKSKEFWTQYYRENKKAIYPLLNNEYKYADAQVTRIYINRKDKNESAKYFALWKSLWKDKDVLLVEGELSRFGVGNDLFDEVKSLKRILCPPSNAFDYYKEIKEAIQRHGKDKLVLLVLGPTATILAYDLAQIGYWVIDSGNLDMEYEWLNRGVSQQTAITGKYTHEAKDGDSVEANEDVNYVAQIIEKIGV